MRQLSSGSEPAVSNGSARTLSIALYLVAITFYWASLYFYVPTLPVYVEQKVASLAAVGTILSMYGLWQALVRLPLGILADWIGWRKPFILGGFLLAAAGAWMMAVSETGFGIGAGRSVTGLAAAAWVPLTVAFSALFPAGAAVRASSILMMANSVSRMVATGMTGWLNGLGGYSLAFFVAMVVALLALLVFIPAKEERNPPVRPSWSGVLQLISRADVLRPAVMSALSQYVTWSATLGFTPILADQLGATDMTQSALTSGSIGVMLIGNLLTAALERRIGNRGLSWAGFALMGLGGLLAAFATNLAWLYAAQFIASLGAGIAQPLLMGLSIAKVENGQRATAMGLHQAVYGIGMFAGPSLSGALADWMDIQPMFGVTGFLCLVLGYLGVRWMMSGR